MASKASLGSSARERSFLAVDEASDLNKFSMMFVLLLITATEGADNALFPAVTAALEQFYPFFSLGALGWMSFTQGITTAIAGPLWGMIASRATFKREHILAICTVLQGGATCLMTLVPGLNFPTEVIFLFMYALRITNGVALAGLRPIANSVVGDAFDDQQRGKMFGFIMAAMNIGAATTGIFAATISRREFGWMTGLQYGWQVAFWTVGLLTMALAPLCVVVLKTPAVKPDPVKLKLGAMGEIQTLAKLCGTPTFAILVVQGCFGLIPWRAFEFRTFFLQMRGLSDSVSATANSVGGFVGALGAFLGGSIGDFLANVFHQEHGRILTAEISVFSGIPIALFTFLLEPPAGFVVLYYVSLIIILSLVATWPGPGCNSPVLCAISEDSERSLVLAWQTSLEGAAGSLGPLIFTFLLEEVFGYNRECNDEDFRKQQDINKEAGEEYADCANASAAGQALFWTSCAPWAICGLFYTSLHFFYPSDLTRLAAQRELTDQEMGRSLGETERTGRPIEGLL